MAFLKQFIHKVSHVHIKDVSESLAAATRGAQTGIAVSHCALGQGVNADNIRRCLEMLRDRGYNGVLSMECEGQGGVMIEQSLQWMRDTLAELKQKAYALDIRFEKEKDEAAERLDRPAIGQLDKSFVQFLEEVDLADFDRERLIREALKYLTAPE